MSAMSLAAFEASAWDALRRYHKGLNDPQVANSAAQAAFVGEVTSSALRLALTYPRHRAERAAGPDPMTLALAETVRLTANLANCDPPWLIAVRQAQLEDADRGYDRRVRQHAAKEARDDEEMADCA